VKDLDFGPQDMKIGWDSGSDLELENFTESAEQAKVDGFEVLVAQQDELFFDLDTEDAMTTFDARLDKLIAVFTPNNIRRWRSKSGQGWHVTLTIKGLSLAEKVAIQACMGSDPLKELLTIAREKFGSDDVKGNTIRLFRPANTEVQDWVGKFTWLTPKEQEHQWDNLL
jgi:hypothetical protein